VNTRQGRGAKRRGPFPGDLAMVTLARRLMILTAVVLSPVYVLWIAGGKIADARERKRRLPSLAY
jgi:hypothetical protein